MGEWIEVKPKPYSPCDGCQMGSCSVSQKYENGKLYTKTDDCHETCKIYVDNDTFDRFMNTKARKPNKALLDAKTFTEEKYGKDI